MKQFIVQRWPQISSKLGTALPTVLLIIPNAPTWVQVLIVVSSIVLFGADEDKVVAKLKR